MDPKPVLYVLEGEPLPPACQKAIDLLRAANCPFELRTVPVYDPVAIKNGLPTLYGLGFFCNGWQGVQDFILIAQERHHLQTLPTDIPNRDV